RRLRRALRRRRAPARAAARAARAQSARPAAARLARRLAFRAALTSHPVNERDYHDQHYANEARIFASPLFARVHDRSAADFLRLTGAGPAQRMLSLGCGDGAIERRLA